MKPLVRAGLFVCMSWLSVVSTSTAAPWVPVDVSRRTPGAKLSDFVGDHLKIGFRPVFVNLQDDLRNPVDSNGNGKIDDNELLAVSFLGSINKLDGKQDYGLPSLYARWMFTDWVGLDLTWEKTEADAVRYWGTPGADGTFFLEGPMLSILVQYPNDSIFTPAIGVGMAFLSSDFEEDPAWHGTVTDIGIRQWIDTMNDNGIAYLASCDIRMSDALSIIVYGRYLTASVDAHYYITTADKVTFDDRGITEFPMDSMAAGAGIQYSF